MDNQKPPLMKCGHQANATDNEGIPVCVICIGITILFEVKYDGNVIDETEGYNAVIQKTPGYDKEEKSYIFSEVYDYFQKKHNLKDRSKIAISYYDAGKEVSDTDINMERAKEAACRSCHKVATASGFKLYHLPFYDSKDNSYYCGCDGWN